MLRCTGVRLRVALLAVLSLGLAACGITEPDVGPLDVTGISVSSSTTTIGIGTTLQLTATVTPAGASQSVTWSSSDDTRVTISATGLASAALAPLVAGSVRVTATSAVDATLSSFADLTITCGPLVSAAVTNGGTLAEDTCYVVESALTVSDGTLFVEPGVRISFGPSGSLSIRSDGRLNAVGTMDKEITFTSSDAAGSWRGIRFDGSRGADNVLRYVTIENGGSDGWSGATQSASALLLEGNSLVDIQQSTIEGSASRGITLYADAEMTFEDNLLRDNGVPVWVHPNTVGYLDPSNIFENNADEVVRVGYGNTGTLTTAQTWHDVGIPFEIQHRTFIEAPLRLDPGVVLESRADVSLIVRVGGTLTASGTAMSPITFGSAESAPGAWQGLQITTLSGDNVFDHVIFEYGGGQPWTGGSDSRAMVYLQGNSKAVFSNSVFRGSAHYGLWVPAGGDISGFDDNLFEDNVRTMIVHPNRAGAISPTTVFVGNAEQRVRVTFGNNDAVGTAQVWSALQVPYRVMNRTFIQAPLVIGAGAVVEFVQNAHLIVNNDGSLWADGAPDNRVVFRGSEPLAGYWEGLQFGTASGRNRLEYVDFSNAGSQAWFGGANSIATLYVTDDGAVTLANVAFAATGGYAAIVRIGGVLSCSNVDDNGFQYYVYAPGGNGAQPACPS